MATLSPPTMKADAALAHARAMLARDPLVALAQAQEIIAVLPEFAAAHRVAALALRRLGRVTQAQEADLQSARMAVHDPEMLRAGAAMVANDLHVAEPILKNRLKVEPTDIAAMTLDGVLPPRRM